jgi:hypothetical protein
MRRNVRWAIRGLSLVVGLSLMAGMVCHAKRRPVDPAWKEDLAKAAVLLEKKDSAGTEKLIAELAKKPDVRDVMRLYNSMLTEVGEKGVTEKALTDGADLYKREGYQTAAIGLLLRTAQGKEDDKKKREDWTTFAKELHEAGLAIADAAGKKDGAALKAAALKADGACTKCHTTFRPPLPIGRVRTG